MFCTAFGRAPCRFVFVMHDNIQRTTRGLMGDDGRFGKVCSDPKLNTIYTYHIYMKRETSFAPMEIFVVCNAVAPASIRCYRSAKNTIIKTHYFPFE